MSFSFPLHRIQCYSYSYILPIEEGGSSQVVGLTQAEGHCSSLCERLMNIVVGCSELVQSAVSPGTPTEGLLKVWHTSLLLLVVSIFGFLTDGD